MAKPIDPATRSRMVASIRSSGTRPEVAVRKTLFARGRRYRDNDPRLPGRPNASFARYPAVIMVHGCFWHVHDCSAHQLPRTNPGFWAATFAMNRTRDARNVANLSARVWRQLGAGPTPPTRFPTMQWGARAMRPLRAGRMDPRW